MLDIRERLGRHLYGSALDLDPDAVVAIRIGHSRGLTWRVDDGSLYVTVGGDTALASFPLDLSMQQLVTALQARGVEVKYANPDVMHLSAGALISGSGSDETSSGDQLKVFTSDLWTMLDAYGVEIREAERQIVEGVAQLYVGSADDEILEYWGEYFGVPRNAGEVDDDYRIRMIVEVLRPKNNKVAIENAISEVAGARIELYEPWTDLFYLSVSKLDNERTYNGDDWSPYVFRPVYRGDHNINWSKVLPVIERLRPAGVLMLDPEWVPSPRGVEVGKTGIGYSRSDGAVNTAHYDDRMVLDSYMLGDPVTQNYGVLKFDLYGYMNNDGAIGPMLGMSPRRRFVRAQVVLSDMAEGLEHERLRFPGVYRTYMNTPVLGEFALSEFDPGEVVLAPEDVYSYQSITGGTANVLPEMESGVNFGSEYAVHVRAYDQRKPKVVGMHVVTAQFLEARPTEYVVASGWSTSPEGWADRNWTAQFPTSGVCINVITENQ